MSPARRRVVVFSVLAVLLAAGSAAAYLVLTRPHVTTSSKEARLLYEKGVENEGKMYMREAVESYAAALSKDPYFVMATLRLASALYGRDPQRSEDLVKLAERHRGDVTERERLMIDIHVARHKNDREKVAELVDRYIERFPDDPEGYKLRANILSRNGKPDEAAKVYQQLLGVDPNHAIAYNYLGYFAMGSGDWAKAEEYFKRYRFLAPDQANPFDSLGELYANTGRYEEARESLKQALSVKADFAPSVAHLGTVAVGEGKYLEAAARFHQAAAIADVPAAGIEWDSAAVLALVRAGREEEAESLLADIEAAMQGLPQKQRDTLSGQAALFRAVFAAQARRFEDAERLLAEAEALVKPGPGEKGEGPGKSSFAMVRGTIARLKGDHELAAREYLSALEERDGKRGGSFPYFPYDDVFRADAAESLVAVGKRDEAQALLDKTFQRNPRFQPAVVAASRLGLKAPAAASAPATAAR